MRTIRILVSTLLGASLLGGVSVRGYETYFPSAAGSAQTIAAPPYGSAASAGPPAGSPYGATGGTSPLFQGPTAPPNLNTAQPYGALPGPLSPGATTPPSLNATVPPSLGTAAPPT